MYSSPEAPGEEIQFGATLSPIALRNLFDHSAVHLSVEWRDLPDADWSNEVRTAQGRTVPASETAWMRTREVRMHAVDLDNGATFNDIPAPVLERLLKDITSAWRTRGSDTGLLIKVTGTAENGTGLTFGDTMPPTPRSSRGRCPPSSNGPPGAAAAVWPPPGPAAAGPAGSGGSAPVAPKWI